MKKEKKMDPKYRYLYEDIQDRFQGFFGTKVKLDQGKRKGRIIELSIIGILILVAIVLAILNKVKSKKKKQQSIEKKENKEKCQQ